MIKSDILTEKICTADIQLTDARTGTIDIIFAGDFFPGGRTKDLCLARNYKAIFNETISDLREKDLSVVNLECPLTGEKRPINKIGPHLDSPPECAKALEYGSFNVAALANNHILDHGRQGLKDTLDACREAGIKTVGAGLSSAEIQEPLIIDVKSVKVGFINAAENEFSTITENGSGANGFDLVSLSEQIKQAKEKADIIFLVIHGGNEFYPLPSPRIVKEYRYLAELGVTAIVGHHPHCPGGFEVWGGIPIFYSLGNFVFDWHEHQDELWYKGYFVKLTVDRSSVVRIRLYPYFQFRETAGLHFMQAGEKSSFLKSIAEYSRIIQDEKRLNDRWKEFCKSKKYEYLQNLLRLNRLGVALLKRRIGGNLVLSRKQVSMLLNMMRCEAHRDASIEILEKYLSEKE